MQPKIQVKSLAKRFRLQGGAELSVLENISIEVHRNQFICLLGKSGCGKSTLMRIIGGLTKPSEGQVFIDGVESYKPSNQKTIVFQQDAVFPWMSVERNIEFGLKVRGISAQKRRQVVRHYMHLVGLEEFGAALPKELSGGMRKRVDIARAYASSVDVLLMDEPFGGLDAITKVDMQEALLDLWQREQKTVIFVTHDLEEAAFLADRILIMGDRGEGIKEDVIVALPRPRSSEVRLSDHFNEIKGQLRQSLRGEEYTQDDRKLAAHKDTVSREVRK